VNKNNGKGGLLSSFNIQRKCISMSIDSQLKCLKLNKEVEEKNKILHEEKQKHKEEKFAKKMQKFD
jgi:hypothetical protein